MAVITENEAADGDEERNETAEKGKRTTQWNEMSYREETDLEKTLQMRMLQSEGTEKLFALIQVF